MQIPFNTLTGRCYLYKHTHLRMDYPKLPRKPHLFWKPPGTRVTHQILRALETVKQRSDIYLRNGINCVSVQCGGKKKLHLQTHRRIQCTTQQLTANVSNNYSCREMMDLFITGFGVVLLPVRFMRLNRKDLYYPLSSFGPT